MPRKGHRSSKGVGDLYEEPKTRTNVALTEEALKRLDTRAEAMGISRSELIERFARGQVVSETEFTSEEKQQMGEDLATLSRLQEMN
jgi:metal-responsive CopG/Arc/MetJ family transcriptional regulator